MGYIRTDQYVLLDGGGEKRLYTGEGAKEYFLKNRLQLNLDISLFAAHGSHKVPWS